MILKDCNADAKMHGRLLAISGKVAGRERVILGRTDRGMDKPLKIDDGIYFESYFDTQYLLKVMKERMLDAVGYDYSGILLYVRDPALEKKLQQEADSLEEDMETGPEEETEGLSMGCLLYTSNLQKRFGVDLKTDTDLRDRVSRVLYDQSDIVADFCMEEDRAVSYTHLLRQRATCRM